MGKHAIILLDWEKSEYELQMRILGYAIAGAINDYAREKGFEKVWEDIIDATEESFMGLPAGYFGDRWLDRIKMERTKI